MHTLLTLVLALSWAAEPPRDGPKAAAKPAALDRLIQQLGSDDFGERQAASKALEAAGEPALPALWKAMSSEDAEVAKRASTLVESILAGTKAAVERLGGEWSVRMSDPVERAISVSLKGPKVQDADLALLRRLPSLGKLCLKDTGVTDEGLSILGGMKGLRYLQLAGSPVSDAGMGHLRGLVEVEHLDLERTRVKGPGLAHLKRMAALRALYLSETGVSDDDLAPLEGLTSLRDLGLAGTRVTDAGLAHLKGLKELRGLDLSGTQVSKAGVATLERVLSGVTIVHR
jgi:hypothetical protein